MIGVIEDSSIKLKDEDGILNGSVIRLIYTFKMHDDTLIEIKYKG